MKKGIILATMSLTFLGCNPSTSNVDAGDAMTDVAIDQATDAGIDSVDVIVDSSDAAVDANVLDTAVKK